MKATPKQLAVVLYEATVDAKKSELDSILENFFGLLKRLYLTSRLPQIISEYQKYYLQQQGILAVTAESSRALTSAEESNIIKQLKETTGKKVELTNIVDPSLGGGIKLGYEDIIIDGTLKRRVEKLKLLLKN